MEIKTLMKIQIIVVSFFSEVKGSDGMGYSILTSLPTLIRK